MFSALPLFGLFGVGVGGAAVAVIGHESRRDMLLWREAADALGVDVREGGLMTAAGIEGRVSGVEVSAVRGGLDTDSSGRGPHKTCAVTGRVRLPLPPGVQVRRMTQTERTMPLLTGMPQRLITTIADVRVMADDTPEAHRLFARPRVRNALVRVFSGRDRVYLYGDRLSLKHSYLGAADIEAAVRDMVDTVRNLEAAMAWDPQAPGERPRRVEARPLVAFGVEAPSPPPSPGPSRAPVGDGDPSAPALLGRLVEALSAEAVEGGEDGEPELGSFTLDREAARRKLAERRLDDPAAFVLDLLRAIQLCGATRIEIRHDADELWVRFDGQGFSSRELDHVYGAAFASSPEPRVQACRHLALALDGATGLGPVEVAVRGIEGRFRRVADDEEVDGGLELEGALDNEFYLRLPRRLRRGRLTPVVAMARSRAAVMDLQVVIDDAPVPSLNSPRGRWGYTPFRANGLHGERSPIRGWVAFDLGGSGEGDSSEGDSGYGEAYVGRHGVWIERRRLPHAPRRLRAVVMYGELATDLSGRRLVDDAELRRALAALDRAVSVAIGRAVEQLHARRRDGRGVPDAVEAWIRGLCLRGLDRPSVRRGVAGELDEAREHLLDASVWPTVTGRRTSLRKLGREATRHRRVPFVDASLPSLLGVERGAVLADAVTASIPAHAVDVSALNHDQREFLRGIFNEQLVSQTPRLLELVAELTARV